MQVTDLRGALAPRQRGFSLAEMLLVHGVDVHAKDVWGCAQFTCATKSTSTRAQRCACSSALNAASLSARA
jgi:hypothetical protein